MITLLNGCQAAEGRVRGHSHPRIGLGACFERVPNRRILDHSIWYTVSQLFRILAKTLVGPFRMAVRIPMRHMA